MKIALVILSAVVFLLGLGIVFCIGWISEVSIKLESNDKIYCGYFGYLIVNGIIKGGFQNKYHYVKVDNRSKKHG